MPFDLQPRLTGDLLELRPLHGYDEANSVVEMGWTVLARSHGGGAYNGEMKRLMLRHAFRFVGRVVFVVGPYNFRSRRAVEKIGGVPAGTRLDERGQESVVYRIEAAAFLGKTDAGDRGTPCGC